MECIIDGTEPLTTGKYGLKIVQIIEAMYKSAKSKQIEEVNY
jgi:predicted dehydrogenase